MIAYEFTGEKFHRDSFPSSEFPVSHVVMETDDAECSLALRFPYALLKSQPRKLHERIRTGVKKLVAELNKEFS